jgi:hypothetical protein
VTTPVGGPPQRDSPALAHGQLCDAVDGVVPGVRVYRRPGASLNPPAFYVQPPSLTWDAYEDDPTESVFECVLVVAADDRALARLFELLPQVTRALDESAAEAVVKSAEPGIWRVGTAELPAYFIRVEVAL